jgi:hypothetical protein
MRSSFVWVVPVGLRSTEYVLVVGSFRFLRFNKIYQTNEYLSKKRAEAARAVSQKQVIAGREQERISRSLTPMN